MLKITSYHYQLVDYHKLTERKRVLNSARTIERPQQTAFRLHKKKRTKHNLKSTFFQTKTIHKLALAPHYQQKLVLLKHQNMIKFWVDFF